MIVFLYTFCFLPFATNGQSGWSQKSSYTGLATGGVCAFSIGNKGYICCGLSNTLITHKDLWEYDASNDTWTQKADVGDTPRYSASAFSIGQKGYVCLGWSAISASIPLPELLEYDPLLNTWIYKTDFPGHPRYNAVAFVIGNKAYVGLGYNPMSNDFYEYDPSMDTWTLLTDVFPGAARETAIAFSCTFSVGGNTYEKGYVGLGALDEAALNLPNDLWEFTPGLTPGTGSWVAKSGFPGTPRFACFAFSCNDKGYVGGGIGPGAHFESNEFYEYDPASDTWTMRTPYPGINKVHAATFVINNIGYVGCGQGGSDFHNDMFRYSPSITSVQENDKGQIKVYSIPGNIIRFDLSGLLFTKGILQIYSIDGKLIERLSIANNESSDVNLLQEATGIYSYQFITESKKIVSGKFYFGRND